MANNLIIVQRASDWRPEWPVLPVVTAEDYLTQPSPEAAHRTTRIVNLCHSGDYQGIGYYCSLLAEARGQRVLPAVRTVTDARRPDLRKPLLDPLQKALQRISREAVSRDAFLVAFGHCAAPDLADLARRLFIALPMPLIRVALGCRAGTAYIRRLTVPRLTSLVAEEEALFLRGLEHYLGSRWVRGGRKRPARFELAILTDAQEPHPPSNRAALERFERAAGRLGIACERISRHDLGRLERFDGLFIRATTNINHYTYRFAQRAENAGLVVIDDPQSIMRCTNKVFLKELLDARKVPTPRGIIVQRGGLHLAERELGYPMVIKIPDGSFSRGMRKVHDRSELVQATRRMFRESALLLAQEFLYTPFDWRVGILDGEVLYVCRYYMSRNHWQIIDHGSGGGRGAEGGFDTLRPEDAPAEVLRVALQAAALIGKGLYGVDLKETDRGPVVIEVNDNPSIDAGVEDLVAGIGLYDRIMGVFLKRMYQRVG